MSEITALQSLPRYRQAFPDENIYIHSPAIRDNATGKYHPRHRYVFIWRALTPTGKVSKYWHALHCQQVAAASRATLPKLRPGYRWTGPYLYANHTPKEITHGCNG